MNSKPREKKKVTLGFSIFTLLVLIAFIAAMLLVAKAPIVVVMILAWVLMIPFSLYLGYSLEEMESFAMDLIKPAVGVIALMIVVGGMIALWIASGTVPTLIYWGLKIVSPGAFLPIAFFLTSIVSMATGSSWAAVATIGAAMMGIGLGLGLPGGIVAGAVISGSYFGNSFSPMADVTIMTSSVTNVKIWDHIKFMSVPMLLAWGVSAVLYTVIGLGYSNTAIDSAVVNGMLASLSSTFKIHWFTLIPMIVTLVMMIRRNSALISILVGSVIGAVVAVLFQGFSLEAVMTYMSDGFSSSWDNELIATLLNRGGFASMYMLVAIIVGALGIGGILNGTGIFSTIVSSLGKQIKGIAGLSVTTFVGAALTNCIVGTYYFCISLCGTLFPPMYKKLGYKPENPARIINNVANCLVPFLPWNIGCQYMMAQTGVSVKEFAPFLFFNMLIIVFDLVFGIFGIGAKKYTKEEMAAFAAEENTEAVS